MLLTLDWRAVPTPEQISIAALATALGKGTLSQAGKTLVEQFKSKVSLLRAGPLEQSIVDWENAFERLLRLDLPPNQKADLESAKLATNILRSAITREAEGLNREATALHFAASELEANADVQPIGEDWVDTFLDNVRSVSSEEMLKLYGRILASEAVKPGAYSKRAVAALKLFDKNDLEVLSRMATQSIYPVPIQRIRQDRPVQSVTLSSAFVVDAEGFSDPKKYFSEYDEAINLGLIPVMTHGASFDLAPSDRLEFAL